MLRTLQTVVVMIFFLFSAVFIFSVLGVAIFGNIENYAVRAPRALEMS
jgi:hypothetical protein